MYEGENFEEAVENLLFDLNSLASGSVDSTLDQNGDDPRSITIHVEEPEGPDYYIEGKEGDRFFYIKCYYNLVIDIANTLGRDQIRDKREASSYQYSDNDLFIYLPSEVTLVDEQTEEIWNKDGQSKNGEESTDEPDDDTELEDVKVWRKRIAAALDIVNGVSDKEEQEIIFNLVDIFSNVPVKFRVNSAANGGLTGLEVRERIFPYEESFNIKSLDESIVRTRIPANMGMLFFQYIYDVNIRQDEDGTIAENPAERPNFPN
ncbi:hypothetical protein [Halorubellus litoreus]|uniref:Halobacterial output domain-containing protein n=1 Tax=Halorubellus litoreus TaxID=755308 RepID=A0ABD5VPV9_9EURY